jgi:hypothetical protein
MVDSMMLLQEEILRRLYWLLDHPDERGWSRTLVQKLSTDEDQFRTEYLQLAAEELVYPPSPDRGELGFRGAVTAEGIRTAEARALIDPAEVEKRQATVERIMEHLLDVWKGSEGRSNRGTADVIEAGGDDGTARRAFLDLRDRGFIYECTVINGRWGISPEGRRWITERHKRRARIERAQLLDTRADSDYRYDVAISFAGAQRLWAQELAEELKAEGVRVFYDGFEEAELWGKNLAEYFHEVYSQRSRFCVIFVSRQYAGSRWTTHERRSAIERALAQHSDEYILPIRVDDTRLPGLNTTVGFVPIQKGICAIAALLIDKLNRATDAD